MQITAKMVKELRATTGAGIMDCKAALRETEGDVEKAIEFLRKKGLKTAAKKASRAATEGAIGSYVHAGSKIGVLVELNCETDFVARNDEFKELLKDLCLQVAATKPRYVSREQVDEATIAKEREILRAQLADSGKPENIIERIVEGRLGKFYEETCLMEQPFVKDPGKKVRDLITEKIAKIGENLSVRRFVRFEVGEDA